MAAGTITLTNNSTAVSGSGSSFTKEMIANDFIVAKVGGVTYTLGVRSVDSDTSVTLNTAYDGPTVTGAAWSAVSNQTLVGITAQVAADVAKSIRGINFAKDNWQQFYTGSGNITVNLPDNSSVSGPSWPAMQKSLSDGIKGKASSGSNSDITELKGLTTPLSIAQGGTGAKTAAEALSNLGALPKSGGAMTGPIEMGGKNITGQNVNTWSSLSAAYSTLINMGFSSPGTNQFKIPCGTAGRVLHVQSNSAIALLNSSGEATISFPSAFSNEALLVIPILGDQTGATSIAIINYNRSRTTSFDVHVFNQTNSNCRINFLAIGY